MRVAQAWISRKPHPREWMRILKSPWGRVVGVATACALVVLLIWLQRDAAFRPEQAQLLPGADGGGIYLRQWTAYAVAWAQKWPRDRYVAPAVLVLLLIVFLAILPYRRRGAHSWIRSPWLFDVAALAALAALSWPVLALTEMNADESEHIAEALKLLVSPLPWISVDGFSHTPLSAAPLILPVLFHLPIDYGAAKLMHLIGTWANIAFLHRTLRRVYGDVPSRLAVFPAIIAMSFVQERDFLAYNAEVPTTFVLSLGLYLLVRLATLPVLNASSVYFVGLVIGLAPFVKLQGVVPALGLAVSGAGVLVYRLWGDKRRCVSQMAIFALGGASVAILLALYLVVTGAFDSFWNSYILSNWVYANRNPNVQFGRHATHMYKFLAGQAGLHLFWRRNVELGVVSALLLPVVGAVQVYRRRRGTLRDGSAPAGTPGTIHPGFWPQLGLVALAAVLFFASAYTVVAPLNTYYHYLWFMMIPLALAGATCLGTMLYAFRSRVAIVVGLLAFAAYSSSQLVWNFATTAQGVLLGGRPVMMAGDDVSLRMLQLDKPGHPVAIWGWMCQYYVNTGMYPATRHAISYYAFEEYLQAYFRGLYLEDLQKNMPVLFVDAVAPGAFWFNQNQYRHEAFPELAAWVSAHYRLADDIKGTRIYVREEPPRAPQ